MRYLKSLLMLALLLPSIVAAQAPPTILWKQPQQSGDIYPGESIEFGFVLNDVKGGAGFDLVDVRDSGLMTGFDVTLRDESHEYFKGPFQELMTRTIMLDRSPRAYSFTLSFRPSSGNTFEGRSMSFVRRVRFLDGAQSETSPATVSFSSTGGSRVIGSKGLFEQNKKIEPPSGEVAGLSDEKEDTNDVHEKKISMAGSQGNLGEETGKEVSVMTQNDMLVDFSIREVTTVFIVALWFVLRVLTI